MAERETGERRVIASRSTGATTSGPTPPERFAGGSELAAPRSAVAVLASLLCCVATAASAATGSAATGPAATIVTWPPSTGLLLAEVVTGGASASDEYFELYNAAATPLDLAGLEVVYATASGSTVTRKAGFANTLLLVPGAHYLVANSAGVFAPSADATYSGGLAADGGALALRRIGGSVLDSIGWGTAANSFGEGSVAPAPPAKSSLERRPGGSEGNWTDTNDNASDWLVDLSPVPQSLLSAPVPAPAPTASEAPAVTDAGATPTPAPTATAGATSGPSTAPTATDTDGSGDASTPGTSVGADPSPTATAAPSVTPTASPSAPATVTGEATAPATPTATPTGTATSTAADVGGSSPTPAGTSSPEPSLAAIADARALADGIHVTVTGVLTTGLAVLDSQRGGFLQDATAGIAMYLPAVPATALPVGTTVRVSGTVYDRYGQRTIRVDDGGLEPAGEAQLPEPLGLTTGGAEETAEGRLVSVQGTVASAPDTLSDGTGLWLDDGSGQSRVVVTPAALAGLTVARGTRVLVVGPLGQRVSGTSAGYRVEVTEPGSLVVIAASPSPSATGDAAASPEASQLPTNGAAESALATSAATEPAVDLESIAAARTQALGDTVHVAGVVTMAPGATGASDLLVIEDSSGGLFLRIAAPVGGLVVGRSVEVVGVLAAPYGQLEVRAVEWLALGSLDLPPDPTPVKLDQIGERTEGLLVTARGTVDSVRTDSGRLTLAVGDGATEVRVLADPSSGLTRADVARGDVVLLIGVAGQRSSSTGAADGYRLWLRGRSDLQVLPAPEPTTGAESPTSSAQAVHHDLLSAIGRRGVLVDVDATVTATAGLFEINGPAIVVDDGTAAVAVILPDGAAAPPLGARVQVIGKTGSWEGGATVIATHVVAVGGLGTISPLHVSGALDASVEWHVVRVYGRIARIAHAGARWRAELLVDGRTVVVLGEPGAAIPSTGLVVGRLAAVTGIVRRSTSDSSAFQLLPRSARDLLLGPLPATAGAAVATDGSGAGSLSNGAGGATAPRVDIAALAGRVGDRVTISGLVTDCDGATATVADGTGEVRIGGSAAADAISLLEPGDAVEVEGAVTRDSIGLLVEADVTSMITLSGGSQIGSSPQPSTVSMATAGGTPGSGGAARFMEAPDQSWPGPGPIALVALLAVVVLGGAAAGLVVWQRRRARSAGGSQDPGTATDSADGDSADGGHGTDSALDAGAAEVDEAPLDEVGAANGRLAATRWGPLARWAHLDRA